MSTTQPYSATLPYGPRFPELPPRVRRLILTWMRSNGMLSRADALEAGTDHSTCYVVAKDECIFIRLVGICLEPALAWRESGAWTCESDTARELVESTLGLSPAIA